MSYESTEVQKDADPNITDGYDKVDHRLGARSHKVGKNGRNDKEEREGCEGVTNRDEDILKATLTLKEGGKTPVYR